MLDENKGLERDVERRFVRDEEQRVDVLVQTCSYQ